MLWRSGTHMCTHTHTHIYTQTSVVFRKVETLPLFLNSGCLLGYLNVSGNCTHTCDADNPCQNGGSCNMDGDSYNCTCPSNWTGVNCTGESHRRLKHVFNCNLGWAWVSPTLIRTTGPRMSTRDDRKHRTADWQWEKDCSDRGSWHISAESYALIDCSLENEKN